MVGDPRKVSSRKTGQMYIWAQGDRDSTHTTCAGINWTKISAPRRGSGLSHTPKPEAIATDASWERENNQFPPAESHWTDQPHPSAGLIHGSSLVNMKRILWCLQGCGCMFSYHCLFFFNFHCLLLLERDREHGVDGEGLGSLQGEERL